MVFRIFKGDRSRSKQNVFTYIYKKNVEFIKYTVSKEKKNCSAIQLQYKKKMSQGPNHQNNPVLTTLKYSLHYVFHVRKDKNMSEKINHADHKKGRNSIINNSWYIRKSFSKYARNLNEVTIYR